MVGELDNVELEVSGSPVRDTLSGFPLSVRTNALLGHVLTLVHTNNVFNSLTK